MRELMDIFNEFPPDQYMYNQNGALEMEILSTLWPAHELREVIDPSSRLPALNNHYLKHAMSRHIWTENGVWGIPCQEGVNDIIHFLDGTPLLEVMGGTGYLSYWLQQRGVDVICTDRLYGYTYGVRESKRWFPVRRMRAPKAVRKFPERAVLVSWIPCGGGLEGDDEQMLKNMLPGKKLVVIGEGESGCTGSADFFDYLEDFFEDKGCGTWVSAHGIWDCLRFYTKR